MDPRSRFSGSHRGPTPLEDALPIAQQIVAELEATHEAGIVLHDLKLANIKVRPDGTLSRSEPIRRSASHLAHAITSEALHAIHQIADALPPTHGIKCMFTRGPFVSR